MLEASSLLRFIDRDAGASRVDDIFSEARAGRCEVVISAVNWGEVLYTLGRRDRLRTARDFEADLRHLPLVVVAASGERARDAAALKLLYSIPYADCFALQLASASQDHLLLTADFDMLPAAATIQIEFLPTKPKP